MKVTGCKADARYDALHFELCYYQVGMGVETGGETRGLRGMRHHHHLSAGWLSWGVVELLPRICEHLSCCSSD